MTIHLYVSPTPHDVPHVEWEIVCEDGVIISVDHAYWSLESAVRAAEDMLALALRNQREMSL